MKLNELIKEEQTVSLIGMNIGGKQVTWKTSEERWNGDFKCSNKELRTLEGAPKEVGGNFICSSNNLTSLKGAPETVGGDFICGANKLKTLEGGPKRIDGWFNCSNTGLTSLVGAPKSVGSLWCNGNKLRNLKDIHKIFTQFSGEFQCSHNPITSHVLGLLLIPGITSIFVNTRWADILNIHLGKGRAGLIDCQNELIDAGLEEYAQL